MDRVGLQVRPGNHRGPAADIPSSVKTRGVAFQAPKRPRSSPEISLGDSQQVSKPAKVVKKEEKEPLGLFDPWLEIPMGKHRPMKVWILLLTQI